MEEIIEDGVLTGYEKTFRAGGGVVVCIDGLAYGDGRCEADYAERVFDTSHMSDR